MLGSCYKVRERGGGRLILLEGGRHELALFVHLQEYLRPLVGEGEGALAHRSHVRRKGCQCLFYKYVCAV